MDRKSFSKKTLLAAILLFGFFSSPALAEEIVIITHKANQEAMTLEGIRNYFKGSKAQFNDGVPVLIMDHSEGMPARKTFLEKVVGMSADAWNQHWLELKSKSGKAKPKQTKSAKFIIRLVSRKKGAIAYVERAKLKAGSLGSVRVVATVN